MKKKTARAFFLFLRSAVSFKKEARLRKYNYTKLDPGYNYTLIIPSPSIIIPTAKIHIFPIYAGAFFAFLAVTSLAAKAFALSSGSGQAGIKRVLLLLTRSVTCSRNCVSLQQKKRKKSAKPRILYFSTHILSHRVAHPTLIFLEKQLQVRAVLCTSSAASFVNGVVYTCCGHPG